VNSRGSLPEQYRLPLLAVFAVLLALIVLAFTGVHRAGSRTTTVTQGRDASQRRAGDQASPNSPTAAMQQFTAVASGMSATRAAGQLVIAGYHGLKPPTALLDAIRAGKVGAVVLLGTNTDDSVGVTASAVQPLKAAAAAGHDPGLLVMTDQEGANPGLPATNVKRLEGAPTLSAAQMSDPTVARQQGRKTASLLTYAGVNVDLAPVADVATNASGFIARQQRSFGSTPRRASQGACAFAGGLSSERVAYTLKHFPGLGAASASTDLGPQAINESAAEIKADTAAYRVCGSNQLALIMISSASYPAAGIHEPAVLDPRTYDTFLADDGASNTVTISDSFTAGAIKNVTDPAPRAIAAGLDMVMYPDQLPDSLNASATLAHDLALGSLPRSRVNQALERILALKHALGLST
jgi:beta-N-acetylhexosaminidase